MALPTSIQTGVRGRYSGAGITVEMYPSTVRGLAVELQYATANSTASSVWASVILPPSSVSALRHTIPVPESTRLWYMKARHPAQQGYSAGSFTPTINARAKVTPHIQRPILPQMTYQGNVEMPSGADVFVSSAKRLRVGTQVTTGVVGKYLRVPYSNFEAVTTADNFVRTVAGLTPQTGGILMSAEGPVILPAGVKVTQVSGRFQRQSTDDVCSLEFRRVSSGGVGTLLATVTSTVTTGYHTITSSAMSETVSTGKMYHVFMRIENNTASFLWAQFNYETGNLTTQTY